MATSKKKRAPAPVEVEDAPEQPDPEQPDDERPEVPTAFTINYAKDGFGGSGYVTCLDITVDAANPNILWLHDALLPDRRTGRYVNSYIYIIPTRELITMVTDGHKLTWDEVNTRQ